MQQMGKINQTYDRQGKKRRVEQEKNHTVSKEKVTGRKYNRGIKGLK